MINKLVINTVIFILMAGISNISYSQTLEEAVQFIYCADNQWGPSCGLTAEFNNCSVEISIPSLGNTFQIIHFDKVIWNSAKINLVPKNITASCNGICMEDPDGLMAQMAATMSVEAMLVDDYKIDAAKLSMGHVAAPQRVLSALNVVMQACPGTQSKF